MTIASWLKRGGWFGDTRQEQKNVVSTMLHIPVHTTPVQPHHGILWCDGVSIRATYQDEVLSRHRPTYCRKRKKKIRHGHYCMGIPLGNR
ncbi:hypothetical protein PoMZ_07653 [Pyricularia oryzae]|uniref:Uncharacterized protein n=1 Tax=Pyricularia oryzae TaxID=318829 RepID=A0A4P7NFN5_PYROR|nr:hypothetical protein PoMZ_07653 [Pyricularia oryzae]